MKRLLKIFITVFVLCMCLTSCSAENNSNKQTLTLQEKQNAISEYKSKLKKIDNQLDEVPASLLKLKVWVLENQPTKGEEGSLLASTVNGLDGEFKILKYAIDKYEGYPELDNWTNYSKELYSTYKQYSIDYLRNIINSKDKEEQLIKINRTIEATKTLKEYSETMQKDLYKK
ncbi:hypothetical protein [Finegoldia magna]|uniref:Lipoprotein n=1 Tax=Finegoldia magna (strain ATCC 29328 / DSM 20472 / WAL 2508) TaxID=334413 RepID=B0S4G3_FINM2|nr:hypothetical protein [Finegoldia magna]UEA71164.1 hypothetical protein LK415_08610 [Finegoldia magna]BAG09154.1 hypothetical protein FMG_P0105 [Finegoldia magna ATCC 29328]